MYLLFDCNNFFGSCEQVFRPDWRRRPLVVLSNNDGCVVSRSAEAKALGVAMGEPYFKCKSLLESADAVVCSGNFALYHDLSDRIMSILECELPEIQQYSIDEAFSKTLLGDDSGWEAKGRMLRRRILRWTGVPVSVGLAPTKTLAKLANETAKLRTGGDGFFALRSPEEWLPLLEETPIEELWGVGRRLAPRFHALGIRTAMGLSSCNLTILRRNFGVYGERLALELQGISCFEDELPPPHQQMMVSRSFKEPITDFGVLRDVLCGFVEIAARRLRSEELMAGRISVALRTSRYEASARLYADSAETQAPFPSDDTRIFCKLAGELLEQLFHPGYPFRKLGVMLSDLQPVGEVHPTFDRPRVASDPLMGVLDSLQKSGFHVHFANHSGKHVWRHSFRSRKFTTNWNDIPEAY